MKEYRISQSIYFRNDDVDKTWGRVTDVLYSQPSGKIRGYRVAVERDSDQDPYETSVSLDQIIDLDEVSAKAGEALARFARQDREQASLLHYLLGELSSYAEYGGKIVYRQPSPDGGLTDAEEPLQELIDRYKTKIEGIRRG